MKKQAPALLLIASVLVMAAPTVYMYFSADANFLILYRLGSFVGLFMILATITISSRRSNWVLAILAVTVLVLSQACPKMMFMGSMERFLYAKNQALYKEAVQYIVDRNLVEDIDFHGDLKKLTTDSAYVVRSGKDLSVHFYLSGPGVRSKIVYANSIDAFWNAEGKNYAGKRIHLDRNWWIVRE